MDTSENDATRIDRIVELLQPAEGDFNNAYNRMLELRLLVHEHMGNLIAEPMNRELASRPIDTREDKQVLCRWCNSVARSLGLAVRDPVTGNPAALHIRAGPRPAAGSFQIELLRRGEHKRTASSMNIPKLEWIPFLESSRDSLGRYWANKMTNNEREI